MVRRGRWNGVSSRSFPRGLSWLPLAGAALLLIIVSAVAFVPNYTRKQVSSQTEQGAGATGDASAGSSGGSGAGSKGRSYLKGGSTSGGGTYGGGATGGSAGGGGSGGGGGQTPQERAACAAGHNGGSTAPGVTSSEIDVASTIVTDGVGAGFLGEAQDGMKVAVDAQNQAGGICGRRLVLKTINSNWNGPTGQTYIQNFISSGKVFALVGQPDSEGLDAALSSGTIDQAQIPVVGTDGLLKRQYTDPWVWPVGVSTVSSMHIIAKYAHDRLGATSASQYGIVFDTAYKFGPEGAKAFDAEVNRLTGGHIDGFSDPPSGCTKKYCGISSSQSSYGGQIQALNSACGSSGCKIIVLLLEPQPAETWMGGEQQAPKWYQSLFGGEPLFDDQVGENCQGCGGQTPGCGSCSPMIVWTGLHPPLQPFNSEPAVSEFCGALKTEFPSDDCHNVFTESAYVGMKLFIAAAKQVGPNLTRTALRDVLNGQQFNFGLTGTPVLNFGTSSPRVANSAMTAYQENYKGGFAGWGYYQNLGFISDPDATKDIS